MGATNLRMIPFTLHTGLMAAYGDGGLVDHMHMDSLQWQLRTRWSRHVFAMPAATYMHCAVRAVGSTPPKFMFTGHGCLTSPALTTAAGPQLACGPRRPSAAPPLQLSPAARSHQRSAVRSAICRSRRDIDGGTAPHSQPGQALLLIRCSPEGRGWGCGSASYISPDSALSNGRKGFNPVFRFHIYLSYLSSHIHFI